MHSVKVTLIANQEIIIDGKAVNIHDIKAIVVNEFGVITQVHIHNGWHTCTLSNKDSCGGKKE